MKYLQNLFFYSSLCLLITIIGCDDEEDLNLNLTEVQNLLAPEDNVSIALKPSQNISTDFQWDRARAEDGSLVLYEVVFDQVDGDFSAPFYSTLSNGKGVENKLTLSHADLNSIASMGGADFFEKKKFKWTVLASKGSNIKITPTSKIIELERPGGFAVLPSALYITGTATEGGDDVSQALKMKQTAPGKFEIYTKLAPGNYKFLDGLSGSARTFFITEEDGQKVVGTDSETTYSGTEKVYRIRVDFNAISARIDEVKSVGFWYCWENKVLYDLNYDGGGIWRINGVTVTLSSVPWGLEERHKYKVVLNDGTADFEEWWGYQTDDSPGQDGKYGSADPSYFHAYLIENNDQWNHAWKLDRTAIQGKVADFALKFTTEEPYASEYVIH
ncbi:SusE domain-containing protein [Chryseolinea sp. H1M3-3]|uniref:SusE domain-containing protein n=1 Tax=Chryseolinea sp. H1M3-3 TaxID=3034144 RepID=UPI0023EBE643|nr:SusE domain-containing protein [Chryseolinea sp. H1M3-3]